MLKIPSLVTIIAQLHYLHQHLEEIECCDTFLNVFRIFDYKICILKDDGFSHEIKDMQFFLRKKRNLIK